MPIERVLFTEEQIAGRVQSLARRAGIEDTSLVMPVLDGAKRFADDFLGYIPFDVERRDVKLQSYEGTESTGTVEFELPPGDVSGRDVIVLEDIVDTGRTMTALARVLRQSGARTVTTVALLYKPSRNTTGFTPDHVGFRIDDTFVVGYGLDYNGEFRDLNYIGEYKE